MALALCCLTDVHNCAASRRDLNMGAIETRDAPYPADTVPRRALSGVFNDAADTDAPQLAVNHPVTGHVASKFIVAAVFQRLIQTLLKRAACIGNADRRGIGDIGLP